MVTLKNIKMEILLYLKEFINHAPVYFFLSWFLKFSLVWAHLYFYLSIDFQSVSNCDWLKAETVVALRLLSALKFLADPG